MDSREIHKTKNYQVACAAVISISIIAILIVEPMIHGGTLFHTYLTDILLVLGAYASLELFRGVETVKAKVLVACIMVPMFSLLGFALYFAIPYLYSMVVT